jgi:hypothetical protein
LGETGVIPPTIGVWAPNVLFMAAGLYIYFRKANEREIAPKWLHLEKRKR